MDLGFVCARNGYYGGVEGGWHEPLPQGQPVRDDPQQQQQQQGREQTESLRKKYNEYTLQALSTLPIIILRLFR